MIDKYCMNIIAIINILVKYHHKMKIKKFSMSFFRSIINLTPNFISTLYPKMFTVDDDYTYIYQYIFNAVEAEYLSSLKYFRTII